MNLSLKLHSLSSPSILGWSQLSFYWLWVLCHFSTFCDFPVPALTFVDHPFIKHSSNHFNLRHHLFPAETLTILPWLRPYTTWASVQSIRVLSLWRPKCCSHRVQNSLQKQNLPGLRYIKARRLGKRHLVFYVERWPLGRGMDIEDQRVHVLGFVDHRICCKYSALLCSSEATIMHKHRHMPLCQ